MCGLLLNKIFGANTEEVRVLKRRFNCLDVKVLQHLEKIGLSFLSGYNNYLIDSSDNFFFKNLENVEIEYWGFAYEGLGMGMELLDNLPFNNKNRLKSFIQSYNDSHIYTMHVGAGWALARLPIRIEKAIQKFDNLLRWLVLDGYGFHQAYFHTKKYVDKKQVPKHLSEFALHVFYQGVGRCLWFIEGTQPDKITLRIEAFSSDFHKDLWAGVGLACAYAGGLQEKGLNNLLFLSDCYNLHLAQGVCFGAKARLHSGIAINDTELCTKIICGLSAKSCAEIADKALPDTKLMSSEQAYDAWRSNIRNMVRSYKEKVLTSNP
jgi:hypothetical protein